jgi:hypothetical protein
MWLAETPVADKAVSQEAPPHLVEVPGWKRERLYDG